MNPTLELKEIEPPFVHRPWELTPIDLLSMGLTLDYPQPMVEPVKAAQTSRAQLWRLRKDPLVKEESRRLLQVHVRPASKKR